MELIGKNNGRMIELKFLYSAIDDISKKEEITVTDYLAIKAFVIAEKQGLEEYAKTLQEDGRELSRDADAYLDLLFRMTADLSYTGEGIESAIFSAQSTACWAFYHWGLDKEK
ncbi:TPA: hypothetical protein ACJHGT_002767 [Yersinia enterocolitica]|uniref:hypothetical protein n=1 Tax=Yersinia TaxID=629 RepID=UPI0005DE34E9|nr:MULTISPECIES: hypothetical protein [Yersinia]EKN3405030.1 hypothetical protein [Yersinia enterocolitica]EKN3995802.1 hypothetical protein [Yersinia enterocolitica]EKN4829866.1 hypothetical protein [Yersinia enterocolitica]EKN4851107.1 hypothetical protein [Yersinia enterocolitica]EKN5086623.1 hypothetical protein [Yersinia enterocolitica]